jgi:hypothetical protein
LDQPSGLGSKLNQKTSRIQILDIQQGTEIMQSMQNEKLKREQGKITTIQYFGPKNSLTSAS